MGETSVALPSRAALGAATVEVLHRGNARNPDVLLVATGGQRVVVKDFAPRGPFVRHFLAPLIHRQEIRAYHVLAGCEAVPRFLGRVDRLAFAVEYRPGPRMSRRLQGQVPRGFCDELEGAVRAMHRRGVVHLDLRHRSNVLVGGDGRPVLIDFASAICLRPGSWLARWLLPPLAALDLSAVGKWRVRLEPQSGPADAGASAGGRGESRPT
ncbi:MAG: hypothetical protein ABFS46_04670 [Myxococcota bacterium]